MSDMTGGEMKRDGTGSPWKRAQGIRVAGRPGPPQTRAIQDPALQPGGAETPGKGPAKFDRQLRKKERTCVSRTFLDN